MQLYNCKVRLHGNLLHEVRKYDVTAPEVAVLRVLHGDDAVVEIEHTGYEAKEDGQKRSDTSERVRLEFEYGGGLAAKEMDLNRIFGMMGALPDAVPGVKHIAPPKPTAKRIPPKTVEPSEDIKLASDDELAIPEFEAS